MGWHLLLDHDRLEAGTSAISKWSLWLAIGVNVVVLSASYLYLNHETNLTLALLFAILVVVPIITLWNLILRRCFEEGKVKRLKSWLILFLIAAMMMAMSPVYSFIKNELPGSGFLWIFFPNIFILLTTLISLTWSYFKRSFEQRMSRRMQIISWQAGGLSLVISYLPFLLWTTGWIPLHEFAIGIAGIAVILVLIWASKKIRTTHETIDA
jgi:hypothetical protein